MQDENQRRPPVSITSFPGAGPSTQMLQDLRHRLDEFELELDERLTRLENAVAELQRTGDNKP